jgi:hypothetical protein
MGRMAKSIEDLNFLEDLGINCDCQTTPIAVATLNLAVGMIDRASLAGSLNKAEIAPDFTTAGTIGKL